MSERRYYVLCEDNCRFESLTREQILEAIEQAMEQGYVSEPENAVFSRIKEIRGNNTTQIWIGTEAQFNAISPAPNIHKSIIRLGTDGKMYICSDDTSLDDLPVAEHRQTHSIGGTDELTGADMAVTGYSQPITEEDIVETDTINEAIAKTEKKADNRLPLNGGTLTGTLMLDKIVLTSESYGDELPAAGTVGRLFFKKADSE